MSRRRRPHDKEAKEKRKKEKMGKKMKNKKYNPPTSKSAILVISFSKRMAWIFY
jgi:hypothetical protein